MVLKFFNKSADEAGESQELVSTPTREQRLENNLRDLGLEVLQLRQDINSMMAHQQNFKTALSRLREYLEDRGALEEASQEIQAPFQELLTDEGESQQQFESPSFGSKYKINLH